MTDFRPPVRLRYLLKPREVTGRPDMEVLSVYRDHGVVPKASRDDNFNKTPLDLSRYQVVRRGDLVVNKMKAWQGSVAVSTHEGIVSPDYLVCSVDPSVHSGYLHFLLRSLPLINEFRMRSKGIRPAQWRLYWEDLADISVRLPDFKVQRRIADFLDYAAERVNAILTGRRRQVGILRSREPSLLEQFTQVPNARAVRIKYLCSRITSGPRGWGELVADSGSLFLRITNIPRFGVELLMHDLVYVNPPSDAERERSRTRLGDVLVSITADIGSVGIVDTGAVDANVSQHLALLRPMYNVCDPSWLAYAIKSPVARNILRTSSYGGTKVGLSLGDVAELAVPLPAMDEQRRRSEEIAAALSDASGLQTSLIRQCDLLMERKRALITAAVTGEIDVSTARGVEVA